MLSLGCERLPTPLKKKKKKALDHYLHHDLSVLPLLRCCFAHLLILQYPYHHQNLISSSLYYSGPIHKISSQSVHNFVSNVVHRQTNKQTDRQTNKLTNATKNITSFTKEVIRGIFENKIWRTTMKITTAMYGACSLHFVKLRRILHVMVDNTLLKQQ